MTVAKILRDTELQSIKMGIKDRGVEVKAQEVVIYDSGIIRVWADDTIMYTHISNVYIICESKKEEEKDRP